MKLKVGDIDIQPVFDAVKFYPAGRILRKPGADGDPWEAHRHLLTADGELKLEFGGFLIRTGDRLILVDAGLGDVVEDEKRGDENRGDRSRGDRSRGDEKRGDGKRGMLLASLHALGVSPEQVTDVVFTHLHFDHVGWATRRGRIVFPNATYRCDERDWAHFVDGEHAQPAAVRKLAPIRDRLVPFTCDTATAAGVDVRHAPGHTPGSTIVVISSGVQRALLIGDVVHCPVELTENDWEALVDVDPLLAQETRDALAREIEASGVPVAAAHFPGLRFGRLLAGIGRRMWSYD